MYLFITKKFRFAIKNKRYKASRKQIFWQTAARALWLFQTYAYITNAEVIWCLKNESKISRQKKIGKKGS